MTLNELKQQPKQFTLENIFERHEVQNFGALGGFYYGATENLVLDAEEKVSEEAKELFREALYQNVSTPILKKLTAQLCKDFGCVEPLKVSYSGYQKGKKDHYIHGCYRSAKKFDLDNEKLYSSNGIIEVYKYFKKSKYAKRKISPIFILDTFVHEFCHHLDQVMFNIKTEHYDDFYFRCVELESVLLGEEVPKNIEGALAINQEMNDMKIKEVEELEESERLDSKRTPLVDEDGNEIDESNLPKIVHKGIYQYKPV